MKVFAVVFTHPGLRDSYGNDHGSTHSIQLFSTLELAQKCAEKEKLVQSEIKEITLDDDTYSNTIDIN